MIIDDLTIALLMLTGVRLVGSIMFFLLFFQYKKIKYFMILIGWFVYMTGPLVELVKNSPIRTEFGPYFGFSAAFASILIVLGLFSYYKKIKKRYFLIFILACFLSLLTIYFLNSALMGVATTIMQAVFLLVLLVMVVYNSKMIRQGRTRISYFWLCTTLVVGIFHAFGFQLIFSSSHLSIRFVLTGMINISLLLFLLYLDWEQAQAGYEETLTERSILLQEVHHRVKNNLTIVSSMLRLQSNSVSDDKRELITNIENRINTMAIVHEQLYQSGNFKDIRMNHYIDELLDAIGMSYGGVDNPVKIISRLQPVTVNVNILIPIGMLINEIVTNAYKHAFKDVDSPEIYIYMYMNENKSLFLKIKDNGKGIEGDDDVLDRDSTGFTIINALKEQLLAEIEMSKADGMSYSIKIPIEQVEKNLK